MKDNFFISIESMHVQDDLGEQENVREYVVCCHGY